MATKPSAWALEQARALNNTLGGTCQHVPHPGFGAACTGCIALAIDAAVAERDVAIAAKDAALRSLRVDDAGTDTEASCANAIIDAALALTPNSMRELAAAERKVIEVGMALLTHMSRDGGWLRPMIDTAQRDLSMFRCALVLLAVLQGRAVDQPPAQPHRHNGGCRWRRGITHIPGEERGGG